MVEAASQILDNAGFPYQEILMTLYAGLMSGTSMDGIDVALMQVETHQLVQAFTKPYSSQLKDSLQQIASGNPLHLATLGQAHTLAGREFAEAVLDLLQAANVSASDVKAIGSHGQTVAHDASHASPYTLQLGCAHTIAERTGIPVVSDFRTRDLVLGGQGAPFAPLYHQAVFAHLVKDTLAVVNIGGIANITLLTEDGVVCGFDTGPGNCLLDAWIQRHQGVSLDKNGDWAASGQVDENLLASLQQEAFFQKTNPKSIGKEYYSHSWLAQFLPKQYQAEDIQATLLALTAVSIAEAAKEASRVLVCGGGAHNKALMDCLSQYLPQIPVQSTAAVGISPDYLEAMMFAWLASKTMRGEKLDLRVITGSQAPALLGVIYPV